MKRPEDIKKQLEKPCEGEYCKKCETRYFCDLGADALAYIQQLENQLADAGKKVEQLEAAQPKWISVEERLLEK